MILPLSEVKIGVDFTDDRVENTQTIVPSSIHIQYTFPSLHPIMAHLWHSEMQAVPSIASGKTVCEITSPDSLLNIVNK